MCVRWRWALIARLDLPAPELSRSLAQWLQGPRSRALRRAGIGRCERVLEVGGGHGFVTEELARRAAGEVVAVDVAPVGAVGLHRPAGEVAVTHVAADARDLPFSDDSFDLVFFQNTLMWIAPPEDAVYEAARVLRAGGALVALEPDYGGMIEEPDLGLRVIWMDALERAGADPLIGRKLPRLTEDAGLEAWVEFAHIPRPAEGEALDLLAELPLTVLQRERVTQARQIIAGRTGEWTVFLHVPWIMVIATI
ncbi:MAG: methyltransferase domain-containing protein [Armatimonadota bacterium]